MQGLDEIPAWTLLSNFFLIAYLTTTIEHFGNSCLVQDWAPSALSLTCKGNSINLRNSPKRGVQIDIPDAHEFI